MTISIYRYTYPSTYSRRESNTMACCKCNKSGFCRSCACVKARKTCTNCLPMKRAKCANEPTTATGANYAKQPMPRAAASVHTATKETKFSATNETKSSVHTATKDMELAKCVDGPTAVTVANYTKQFMSRAADSGHTATKDSSIRGDICKSADQLTPRVTTPANTAFRVLTATPLVSVLTAAG